MKDLKKFLFEVEHDMKPEHFDVAGVALQSRDQHEPGSIAWLKHNRDYHYHMAKGYSEMGLGAALQNKHDRQHSISSVKWAAKTGYQGLKAYFSYAGG